MTNITNFLFPISFIKVCIIRNSSKHISFIILNTINSSIFRKNPKVTFFITFTYNTSSSFSISIRIYKYRRLTIYSIKYIFRNIHLFPSTTIPIISSTISSIIPNVTFVRSFICPISTRVIYLIPSFSFTIKLTFNTSKFFIYSSTKIS